MQYQLLKDGPHELALLLGLIVDWGGSGATNAGIATSYSTLTPTFYFGKGLGDLPDTIGLVRPFAVTGQIGYQSPRGPMSTFCAAKLRKSVSLPQHRPDSRSYLRPY